jgi:hypothetical protein
MMAYTCQHVSIRFDACPSINSDRRALLQNRELGLHSQALIVTDRGDVRQDAREKKSHIIILTRRLLTMARFLFPVGLLVVQAFADDGECVS